MRIGETKAAPANVASATGEASSQASGSRALITLAPRPELTVANVRAHAPFVAQLLAARDLHPQACVRRRAAPQEAIAAYRSAAALTLH